MACCGAGNGAAGRRRFPVELVRLVLDGLMGAVAVLAVWLASPFSREAARQRRPLAEAVAGSLGRGAAALLDTPFLLHPSARCRASGRLYAVSGALAGAVYRWFNVLVFAAFVAVVSSAALAVARLAG